MLLEYFINYTLLNIYINNTYKNGKKMKLLRQYKTNKLINTNFKSLKCIINQICGDRFIIHFAVSYWEK